MLYLSEHMSTFDNFAFPSAPLRALLMDSSFK